MAFYLIAQVNVRDWDRFKKYQGGVLKSLVSAGGGGRVLAAGKATNLEGEEPRDLTVLMEFPSEEAAQAWYDSEDYAPWREVRRELADSRLVAVEGLEAPPA